MAGARAVIESDPIDLLLCDLGLPDGTGLDVMRFFRDRHPGAPGIALTGYGMEEDIRRTREAGFADHLTKPIRFDRLRTILGRIAPAAVAGIGPGGGGPGS